MGEQVQVEGRPMGVTRMGGGVKDGSRIGGQWECTEGGCRSEQGEKQTSIERRQAWTVGVKEGRLCKDESRGAWVR